MAGTGFINGKEVALTEEENTNANTFHKSRLAFGILEADGKQRIVYNTDEREHYKWLKEDYNIDVETFETMVRGYVMKDKIQFYTGSDFKDTEISHIDKNVFKELLMKAKEVFKSEHTRIFNGVNIGKVGEIWTPKYEVSLDDISKI